MVIKNKLRLIINSIKLIIINIKINKKWEISLMIQKAKLFVLILNFKGIAFIMSSLEYKIRINNRYIVIPNKNLIVNKFIIMLRILQ